MTAITVTEYSEEAVGGIGGSGTATRRMRCYIRFTSLDPGETLDLTTLNANIADIDGINYETDSGAVAATPSTWSTTTYTVGVAGAMEVCLTVRLT